MGSEDTHRDFRSIVAMHAELVGFAMASPCPLEGPRMYTDVQTDTSSSMSPEEIGRRAGQLRDDLRSGTLTLAALGADPLGVISSYGLVIAEQNQADLVAHINRFASTKFELCGPDRAADVSGSSQGCNACDIGLAVAIAALAVLTVIAVAAAVAIYAPPIAAAAAAAFLESQVVFPIVVEILIASSAALASYLCHNLIKC
jgi:hypothetical protein